MIDIAKRVEELEVYSKAYYEGNPMISDKEFDTLEEELRAVDPENEWFSKVRESGANFYGVKRKHLYGHIGSIGKIHSMSESGMSGIYTVSAKLDGSSMTVYYEDGKVLYALTRGDGEYGFDITDKYDVIASKYKVKIPKGFTGAIRGEVVMLNDSWEKYKKDHPDAAMQRNVATGILNRKDLTEDIKYLDWVIYEVVASSTNIDKPSELAFLGSMDIGYPIAPFICVGEILSLEGASTLRDDWSKTYPLDGLVFNQMISVEANQDLGVMSPVSYKEAFKFDAESKESKVKKIVWQMQKSGRLIPVVEIEPVELSGAIVRRATGYNALYIASEMIEPGAIVEICRSNEVIPKIKKVTQLSDLTPFDEGYDSLPDVCPSCGEKLVWKGVHLVCTNGENCPEQRRLRVFDFLRICGGDIKGAGDTIYSLIAKDSLLNTIQFLKSGQFSKFTIHQQNLINQIKDNILNGVTYENLLLSSNIDGLGVKNAKKLCSKNNLKMLKAFLRGEDVRFTGIGPSILSEVFLNRQNLQDLQMTLEMMLIPILDSVTVEDTDENMRYYCVTGSVSMPRSKFELLCKTKGWEMSTVKKAEVLVCNEPSSSSKYLEAQKLGKKIITEREFLDLYLS